MAFKFTKTRLKLAEDLAGFGLSMKQVPYLVLSGLTAWCLGDSFGWNWGQVFDVALVQWIYLSIFKPVAK